MAKIMKRIVNCRVGGGEQNVENRSARYEKDAGLDEKRSRFRQHHARPTGYGSFHERPFAFGLAGILILRRGFCQVKNKDVMGYWNRRPDHL